MNRSWKLKEWGDWKQYNGLKPWVPKRQARETLRGKDQRAQERTAAQGLQCFALLVPANTRQRAITAFLCAPKPCSPERKQHFVLWSGHFWNRDAYSKWPTPSFPEKLLLKRLVCAFYKMDGWHFVSLEHIFAHAVQWTWLQDRRWGRKEK